MGKLINYQYMRVETDISQNIPDEELDNAIKLAEQTLKITIGFDFFEQIKQQYPSYTGENAALFDPYIKQFLAWQAHQYWVETANYKKTRSGIRIHEEDDSIAAPAADMALMNRSAKERAEMFKNLMISFIESAKRRKNSRAYPLYYMDCVPRGTRTTGSQITPIGGKHKKNCNCGCHSRHTTFL